MDGVPPRKPRTNTYRPWLEFQISSWLIKKLPEKSDRNNRDIMSYTKVYPAYIKYFPTWMLKNPRRERKNTMNGR